MLKKLIFLLYLVIINICCFSQRTSRLLIYTPFENYFIPFIETKLNELTFVDGNNEQLFSKISNLNRITSNITTEIALRETVNFYTNIYLSNTIKNVNQDSIFIDLLINFDNLLVININEVNGFIEFQFYLYNVKDLLRDFSNPNNTPISTENVFISLGDLQHKDVLNQALKNLFPIANKLPVPRVHFGQQDCFCDTIHVAVGNNVLLNANFSFDEDTPKELLRFNWNLNKTSSLADTIIKFNSNELNFNVIEPDTLVVSLSVFDGSNSAVKEVVVIAKKPIFVGIPTYDFSFIYYSSLYKNRAIDVHFLMFSNYDDKIDSSNFKITKSRLYTDTIGLLLRNYYINNYLNIDNNSTNTTYNDKNFDSYFKDFMDSIYIDPFQFGAEVSISFSSEIENETYYIHITDGNFNSNLDSIQIKNVLIGAHNIGIEYERAFWQTSSNNYFMNYILNGVSLDRCATIIPNLDIGFSVTVFGDPPNIADSLQILNMIAGIGLNYNMLNFILNPYTSKKIRAGTALYLNAYSLSKIINEEFIPEVNYGASWSFNIGYLCIGKINFIPSLGATIYFEPFSTEAIIANKNYSLSVGNRFYF